MESNGMAAEEILSYCGACGKAPWSCNCDGGDDPTDDVAEDVLADIGGNSRIPGLIAAADSPPVQGGTGRQQIGLRCRSG
jgi:hypothetical protein